MNDNHENVSSLEVIWLGDDKEISNFVIWLSQNFYGNFEIRNKELSLVCKIDNPKEGLSLLKTNAIEIVRYYYDLSIEINRSFPIETIKKEAEIISEILKKLKQDGKDFPQLRIENNGTIVFPSYDIYSEKVENFFEKNEKGTSEMIAFNGTVKFFFTEKEISVPKGYEIAEFPIIELITKDKFQVKIKRERREPETVLNIKIDIDGKTKEFGVSSSNEFIDFQEEDLPLMEEVIEKLEETKIDKAAPKVMKIIETAIVNYEAEIFSKNEKKENFEKEALVFGKTIEIDEIF